MLYKIIVLYSYIKLLIGKIAPILRIKALFLSRNILTKKKFFLIFVPISYKNIKNYKFIKKWKIWKLIQGSSPHIAIH